MIIIIYNVCNIYKACLTPYQSQHQNNDVERPQKTNSSPTTTKPTEHATQLCSFKGQDIASRCVVYYCQLLSIVLRGPGVRGRFSLFLLFLIEKNDSYQDFFSVLKNIVPSQSYRILKSRKFIQLHCAHKL